MRLEVLSGLGEALLHKSGLMMTAIVSSSFVVAIPYHQRVWFSAGDYGVTGVDVAWTLFLTTAFFTTLKIALVCVQHVIDIVIKLRQLKKIEEEA